MPATRAASSPSSGVTLDEAYFLKLIEPLAKSAHIETRFNELLSTINQQNVTIALLNESLVEKDAQISTMGDDIARLTHNQDIMRRKVDDLEQYGRRYSVRINGIPTKADGESEDVKKIVEDCCTDMDTPFIAAKIDRAHRIGQVTTDRRTKKKVQPIIVKFRSWESRTDFFRARPKWTQGGGPRRFSVALDLTKNRYTLLKIAREKIVDNPNIKYAHADLNCRLGLRLSDDSTVYFNSKHELENLLRDHSNDE